MNKKAFSQKGFTKDFLKLMAQLENACCDSSSGLPTMDNSTDGLFLSNEDGVAFWSAIPAGITGSGTTNRIPIWSSSSSLSNSVIIQGSIGDGNYIAIDDLSTGITTTNAYQLIIRNSYPGDNSANAVPQVYISSESTSTASKWLLELTARFMPVNSRVAYTMGKDKANNNLYLKNFWYIGNNSTANYISEDFYGNGNLTRLYASGNYVIGSGVAGDNGFKLEVGGTARITSQLTMGIPTTSAASFNLPIGAAPSAPVDGDVWREDNTNTGWKLRVNGVTKTIVLV